MRASVHLLAPFLLGALVGSLPFAWLLVRWRTGADVSRQGSHNVGALNAARVGRSRALGLSVLLLDALKGVVAVLWARWALPGPHADLAAIAGVVAGHDYNPWLSLAHGRLTGGKGFAAATGGLLLTFPWLVPCWLVLVAVIHALVWLRTGIRDESPSTFAATLLLPAPAAALHGVPGLLTALALAALIGPKHLRDLRALGRLP